MGDNRLLSKDLFKLMLLLNDLPVFQKTLFEIQCGRIVDSKTIKSLLFVLLYCKEPHFCRRT